MLHRQIYLRVTYSDIWKKLATITIIIKKKKKNQKKTPV